MRRWKKTTPAERARFQKNEARLRELDDRRLAQEDATREEALRRLRQAD